MKCAFCNRLGKKSFMKFKELELKGKEVYVIYQCVYCSNKISIYNPKGLTKKVKKEIQDLLLSLT